MTRKKTSADKAPARVKAATASRTGATNLEAPSERVVPVPEIAVFSELPFAKVGMIGSAATVTPASTSDRKPVEKKRTADSAKTATKKAKAKSPGKKPSKRTKRAT